MIYEIQRTRLITETFTVRAQDEDTAIDLLSDCDTVICGWFVDQTALSTERSSIEILSTEAELDDADSPLEDYDLMHKEHEMPSPRTGELY